MGNTGTNGTINTDAVAHALLQYRNTPLREVNKSPAELALGRQLRDTIPLPRHRYKVSPQWAVHLQNREKAIFNSSSKSKEQYDEHSHNLQQLNVGDKVRCQNARSKKWDRAGEIKEINGHRQYTVKLDGSGRLSIRNRRHLSKIVERPTALTIPHSEQVVYPSAYNTPAASASDDTPSQDNATTAPSVPQGVQLIVSNSTGSTLIRYNFVNGTLGKGDVRLLGTSLI